MTENVLKNAKDGSIILMHDRHEKTYTTTANVVDKLRAEGYQFVTLSELLGLTAVSPANAPAAAQPVAAAAQPAALQAPAAGQPAAAGTPVAPAAAATLDALPVPAAAQQTEAPTAETLDESKITRPPGR
jgi:hypothetical protein